jgi:serine/threonine protein kinase
MVVQQTVLAGRYELTSPLGRGGMGQVWEAADTRLDRRVAVKLLNEQSLAGDASDLVRRFAREAAITAGLRHPGVPVVYDVGTYENGLFLVLELVRGSTIADLVAEQGPLPVAWAAGIAAQVAAVLVSAHERSYVHRDIKPQNVMVTPDGTVKVLDFGVAAVLDQAGISRITRTGEAIGTPAYMAPEQLHSLPATPRTDLYALGCVLYEMLAGVPVFAADSPAGLMHMHLQQAPPMLARSDMHPELGHLLLRLLDKEPARRPDARETHTRLLPYITSPGRLGDLDPRGGLHLYSQALVRLAEPPSAPQPLPVPPSPAPPRRGFGWKLLHSLWILPTLLFGVGAWLSFGYFALRHRRAKYLLVALGYLVAAVVGFALIGTSPENHDTLGGTLGMIMWFCLWAGGFLHAAWINVTVHLRPE